MLFFIIKAKSGIPAVSSILYVKCYTDYMILSFFNVSLQVRENVFIFSLFIDGIDFDRTDVVLAFGPNTLPPELCFGVPIIYDFERDSTVSFTVRANSMNAWALTTTTTAAVNIVPVYRKIYS